nr:MerC domain-containing protein [Pseudoalteromonas sp. MMG024]
MLYCCIIYCESPFVQQRLDKLAISISSLCIMHCLLLPIGIVLIPSIGLQMLADEAFHQMLVVSVLLTSCSALFMGCRRHKAWRVLGWGLSGLLLLIAAILFGHDFGELFEKGLTLIGSLFVIIGHIQNYRLCKQLECSH